MRRAVLALAATSFQFFQKAIFLIARLEHQQSPVEPFGNGIQGKEGNEVKKKREKISAQNDFEEKRHDTVVLYRFLSSSTSPLHLANDDSLAAANTILSLNHIERVLFVRILRTHNGDVRCERSEREATFGHSGSSTCVRVQRRAYARLDASSSWLKLRTNYHFHYNNIIIVIIIINIINIEIVVES